MAKKPRRSMSQRGNAPGRLRIVAGNWRGRRLPVLESRGLRPTPERVRETLFNWLMLWIPGKRCLDLFAGTGALGFEALSRGATSVVFVENSRRAATVIEKSARFLDASGATIHRGDADEYLRSARPAAFDIIFLDPPFADDRLEALCGQIDACGILAPGGRVYLEEDRAKAGTPLPDGWRVLKDKTAGNVRYRLVEVTP